MEHFADGLTHRRASYDDATPLARLHTEVAGALTARYGTGPWSSQTTEKGMLLSLRTSTVIAVLQEEVLVGTFHLTRKKPWAIDTSYFTPAAEPLYLLSMAVAPARQRNGIGRWCLQAADDVARGMGADVIRLDAYDAAAGAGDFYSRCGYTEVGKAVYRSTPLRYFERLVH